MDRGRPDRHWALAPSLRPLPNSGASPRSNDGLYSWPLFLASIPGLFFDWVGHLRESYFPSVGIFDTEVKSYKIDMSYESFHCLVKLLACEFTFDVRFLIWV